ncbi:MAG: YraN family protein [Clostridia bacterium]|nr:YraN family protein [Clostridia bacterium]
MKQYASGLTGERQAEAYLAEQGMVCIARRYRGWDGEIDLICRDGETLVMVEVKYRPTASRGVGLSAVTPDKRRRLVHAAQAYLAEQELTDTPVRFDVVEITSDGVCHIRNAF